MENQNRLCCPAQGRGTVKRRLSLLALAGALAAPAGAAENDRLVADLRRQLAERDAEIAALKARLARTEPAATGAPASRHPDQGSPGGDDDELARALESSLTRQGGSVLRPGVVEWEPEASYFYDEPSRGRRRDNFGFAVTGRLGLPASTQVQLRIPYVARDRWSGLGTGSGVGDIQLGVTRELFPERDRTPSLLAFAQWRMPTGNINSSPPTGYGQHALQLGLSAVMRRDPVVLLGSLWYTANLGDAHLHHGARFNGGNLFGGRLGAYLAATPDTSLYGGVVFNSNRSDRFNGALIEGSSRLSATLELGTTTVVGPGRYLNISAGIGVTPAAPEFSLTVSLPMRF